jgi:hypothetical protein
MPAEPPCLPQRRWAAEGNPVEPREFVGWRQRRSGRRYIE